LPADNELTASANPPLVSVVLPTYNRAHLLRRAIVSVLSQSMADFELIVVDDASTDDTESVVQRLAAQDRRIRYVRRPGNGGPAGARNTGLAAARGEFVAFQDSDDEWLSGRLELTLAPFRQSGAETLGLVTCGMLRPQPNGGTYRFPPAALLGAEADLAKQITLHTDAAFTQTWLARRSVLEAAGGFDEALYVWDDWEYLLRIHRCARVRYLEQVGVVSHLTSGSVGTRIQPRLDALAHMLSKHETGDALLLSTLQYLQVRFRALASDMPGARRGALKLMLAGTVSPKLAALAIMPRRWLLRRLDPFAQFRQ